MKINMVHNMLARQATKNHINVRENVAAHAHAHAHAKGAHVAAHAQATQRIWVGEKGDNGGMGKGVLGSVMDSDGS